MKRVFTVIIIMFSILGLVYLYKNTDILDFVSYDEIIMQERQKYSGRWYYNNLTDNQKEIYLYFAKSVDNKQESVKFKVSESLSDIQIDENISKAIEAYIYDYPETFYVEASCKFKTINIFNSKIIEIYPQYTYEGNIEEIKQKMQSEIDNIKLLINDSMSDYEKELIIHDYLVENVKYYDWDELENIPDSMHNAYNAIVNKQAVCDGIAKAFQIIMLQEGIECITVVGNLENVPHAWNIIKIEDEYYHVDLTSDQLKIGETSICKLSHLFFNLTDSEIQQTHNINVNYNYPVCTQTKNNYYYKENKIIKQDQNIKTGVKKIVNNANNEELLEIRVLGRKNAAEEIAQALYDIDFNYYKTNKVKSISYTKTRDVYIYKIK